MDNDIRARLSEASENLIPNDVVNNSDNNYYLRGLNTFLKKLQDITGVFNFRFGNIEEQNNPNPGPGRNSGIIQHTPTNTKEESSFSFINNLLPSMSMVRRFIGGDKKLRYTYKNKRKTRKPRKSRPTRKPRSPRKKFYYY
jgi:hypothetical protein